MTSSAKKTPKPKVPRGKLGEPTGQRHSQATSAEFEREGLGVAPKE